MKESSTGKHGKKTVNETTSFSVQLTSEELSENITTFSSKPSKEEIINQAFQFHAMGNISQAIKYYQYFLDQGFKDYRVFSNYGVILKNLGMLKEAEFSQRKAIELNPNLAEAHSNLGNILRDLGKSEEAELSQRKAIELNPEFANAHYNLGLILKDLGKLKEAEIFTLRAIEINPNYAEAHYNAGIIFRDLQQLDDAILSFKKASELGIDSDLCLSGIGNVLLEQGNHAEGITNLKAGEGVIKFDLKLGLSIS